MELIIIIIIIIISLLCQYVSACVFSLFSANIINTWPLLPHTQAVAITIIRQPQLAIELWTLDKGQVKTFNFQL